jgi:predicted  nucleic acid-binding Zn-ribbon protein
MEKEVKDALNFFIGTATTFKTEIDNIKSKVETEFKSLAEKGAQDTSETAMNVRKYAEETIKEFEKISTEVKAKFDETMVQIKNILPEGSNEKKGA